MKLKQIELFEACGSISSLKLTSNDWVMNDKDWFVEVKRIKRHEQQLTEEYCITKNNIKFFIIEPEVESKPAKK